MWVMRGADGPLRYHNRKEGLIRGGEEEGSQGQEEEISLCSKQVGGCWFEDRCPPEWFFCTTREGTPQEVRVPGMNRRT